MIFLGISIFLCPMRPRTARGTAREEATFFFSNTSDTADGDPQMDSAQMRMRMLLPKKLYRAAGAQKLRRAQKLLPNVRQWVLQCSQLSTQSAFALSRSCCLCSLLLSFMCVCGAVFAPLSIAHALPPPHSVRFTHQRYKLAFSVCVCVCVCALVSPFALCFRLSAAYVDAGVGVGVGISECANLL